MIGIDTNVLLRFLVDDDVEQTNIARRMLTGSNADDPIFVSSVTIAETVSVLTKTLGLITWAGLAARCEHTITFDRRTAKLIPSMELLS